MMLFDRDREGAQEVSSVLGFISDRVDWGVWEAVLPLGVREVSAIVGREAVEALSRFYEGFEVPTAELPAECVVPLGFLRQAVALFTWLKIIPTLDAQHDSNGRQRRLGENERGLTALEQYKDECNIQRMAYEAVDALVECLDRGGFGFWVNSPKYRQRAGLLIRSKEVFDGFYVIGSHRLFLTLLPIIREVQGAEVAPRLGSERLARLVDDEGVAFPELFEVSCRCLVLLTMKKAIERLPVEVLPEGIVQVNQSAPVKQRLKAEAEARQAVAASLGADAERYLRQLEDLVAAENGAAEGSGFFGPIVHSKGMSF